MLELQKSTALFLTLTATLVVSLAGCGGGSIQAEKPTCPASIDSAAALAMINEARSEPRVCGTKSMNVAPPLEWSQTLLTAAAAHSKDMAERNFFDHTNPDGLTTSQRTTNAGYGPYTGENISAGRPSLAAALESLLNSPGHCENIMRPEYKDYAVACANNDKSEYGTYWTQNFGFK